MHAGLQERKSHLVFMHDTDEDSAGECTAVCMKTKQKFNLLFRCSPSTNDHQICDTMAQKAWLRDYPILGTENLRF